MEKILVIEDERNIARAVKDKLSHEGYTVDFVQSGPAAFEYMKSSIPNLIILDLLMPDMDGFQVVEKLKSENSTRNIPIIILSILSEEERFKQMGVNAYLTKPYKGADLIRVVKETLVKHAGGGNGS